MFVDASGDADLCFLAGEETESLDSNVLAGWFYYLTGDELVRAPLSHRYHAQGAREGAAGPFFRGDDAREVNAQLLGSRGLIRHKLDELRARDPQKEIEPVMAPTLPCLRMTRRLCVPRAMQAAQVCHTWLDDTVGLISDWRRAGPVYAVPLGALVAERTVNLLAVGRCLAADVTIWDVTRALPGCVVSGEAAGTAAAVALQASGGDLHRIAVPELQRQLRSQGVLLDPALLTPSAPVTRPPATSIGAANSEDDKVG
ncbi:MAG: FAD-dependent oxidoreductase [Candidatus Marinimicrobia bacterium]|nr:FAD-dependent oxidoreductase [Candidatus Neomarinimicrobiota bacterium]